MYKITDLIEDDHGCEGFMPGEEPMTTLIIENKNGEQKTVKIYDKKAYEMGLDIGVILSDEQFSELLLNQK